MIWSQPEFARFCCSKIRLNGAKKAQLILCDQVGFTTQSSMLRMDFCFS